MTTREKIAVMQAWLDGKQIQFGTGNAWMDCKCEPDWSWRNVNYRVKPKLKEPTYRPYANFDEFRAEWEKHGGWIRRKGTTSIFLLTNYDAIEKTKELSNHYVWADDGTPCGIKVEE